jgi:opacity protein-like surface antigen
MKWRISGVILLPILCSISALAQEFPHYEIFTGYGYVRPAGGQANLNGWHASFAANMNEWLGVAVELSGQYGTQTFTTTTSSGDISVVTDANFHSLGFGPRFTYRRNERIVPFAHVLFGLARGKWSGPPPVGGAETSFGTAAGGGVDAKLSNNFSIRLIQAEYVRTHFGPTAEHQFRLATGALFSF